MYLLFLREKIIKNNLQLLPFLLLLVENTLLRIQVICL